MATLERETLNDSEKDISELTNSSIESDSNHMVDLLRIHHKLGHIQFAKIKQFARQGSIPKYLAKTPTLVCTAFTQAKLSCKAWHSKPNKDNPTPTLAPELGSLMSVKCAFEAYMASLGVSVKAHRAYNGIFQADKGVEACTSKGLVLSFVGVNAHHQNGHAEC